MAKPKFAVEITQETLKSKHPFVAFMVEGRAVELNEENPRFETDDASVYQGIRELHGVKALGELSTKKDGD